MAATLSAFCHRSEDAEDDVADGGAVDEEESLRSV